MKRIHTTDDAGQPVTVTVAVRTGNVSYYAGHVKATPLGLKRPHPALTVTYGLAKASDYVSFAGHTISGQTYADMVAGL